MGRGAHPGRRAQTPPGIGYESPWATPQPCRPVRRLSSGSCKPGLATRRSRSFGGRYGPTRPSASPSASAPTRTWMGPPARRAAPVAVALALAAVPSCWVGPAAACRARPLGPGTHASDLRCRPAGVAAGVQESQPRARDGPAQDAAGRAQGEGSLLDQCRGCDNRSQGDACTRAFGMREAAVAPPWASCDELLGEMPGSPALLASGPDIGRLSWADLPAWQRQCRTSWSR